MTVKETILQAAIERIKTEQSMLKRERENFREFREIVRLTTPCGINSNPREQSKKLVEKFRDTVMSTPDFESTYGESLEECLRQELSNRVADTLLSNQPFSQRLKRDLLVQISSAIESRETFIDTLDTELRSVETAAEELRDVRAIANELPACNFRERSFNSLLHTWENYDELEQRCEQLLVSRQRQLTESDQNHRLSGRMFSLNEYLYGDLETTYPILSAIASTLNYIAESRKTNNTKGEFDQWSPA